MRVLLAEDDQRIAGFIIKGLHEEGYLVQYVSDGEQALDFAKRRNKLMTCGSDAHIPSEFGTATLSMKPFANTADGFRQSLAGAQRSEQISSPLVHLGSTYAKIAKRVLPGLNIG